MSTPVRFPLQSAALPSLAPAVQAPTLQLQPVQQSVSVDYAARIRSILLPLSGSDRISAEGRTMLEGLFGHLVDYLIADPLSQEKRELHQRINEMKEQCNLPLEPAANALLFQSMQVEAQKVVDGILAFRKQELVRTCRQGIELSHLSPQQFEQLVACCTQEMLVLKQVITKFGSLIELAKLPEAYRFDFAMTIFHSGDRYDPFVITVASPSLGYSIFDLLSSLKIRTGDYQGDRTFRVTFEELKRINDHLSQLILWVDDFTLIIGDLFDDVDRARDHFTLGQKPITEILANPIHLSARVQPQLAQMAYVPCWLFNQLTLDLSRHPAPDYIKGKFLEFFQAEQMLGANGKPKQFLQDYPFQTVLNAQQVTRICPHLNKLLKFLKLVKAFTEKNNLSEALSKLASFGQDDLAAMKQYKYEVLNQTFRTLLGPRTPNNLCNVLDVDLFPCMTLDRIEGKSLELCERFLKQFTGLFFQPPAPEYAFSREEITALYDGQRMTAYSGGQQHKDVARLFAKLKNCPALQVALQRLPDLPARVNELEGEFLRRLNQYYQMEGARAMVDEAVRQLEAYVAKIVYQAQSRVSQQSVEASFSVLAARLDPDLLNGCQTGFAGRISDMHLILTSSVGNDLADHLQQYRKECLEAVYAEVGELRDNAESSMAIFDKVKAAQFLGLSPANQQVAYPDLSQKVKTILHHFFAKYHPVSVYHKARTFFADKIWLFNKDNDDERMYALFGELGFGTDRQDLDRRYRVNGDPAKKWQYAYIQQDLPQYLVPFLARVGVLFVKARFGDESMIQRAHEEPVHLAQVVNWTAPQPVVRQDAASRLGFQPASRLPEYQTYTS